MTVPPTHASRSVLLADLTARQTYLRTHEDRIFGERVAVDRSIIWLQDRLSETI